MLPMSLLSLLVSLWASDQASARSAQEIIHQNRDLAVKLDRTAAYLAAEHQYSVLHKQQQVEIDAKLKRRFLAALIAVDRSPLVPVAVKAVRPRLPGLDRVVVRFKDWCRAWVSTNLQRRRRTGLGAVDALLRKYRFEPMWAKLQLGTYMVFVRRSGYVSGRALARRLGNITFVKRADLDFLIGGGDEIAASSQGTGLVITFTHGWGDCPSGCIHRRTYRVSVDAAFRVRYLGAIYK